MPESTEYLEVASFNSLGWTSGIFSTVYKQKLKVMGGSNLIISVVLATFAHLTEK